MLTTKTRIEGDSLVVKLPAALENNIKPNQEYIVTYSSDRVIHLTPFQIQNI